MQTHYSSSSLPSLSHQKLSSITCSISLNIPVLFNLQFLSYQYYITFLITLPLAMMYCPTKYALKPSICLFIYFPPIYPRFMRKKNTTVHIGITTHSYLLIVAVLPILPNNFYNVTSQLLVLRRATSNHPHS